MATSKKVDKWNKRFLSLKNLLPSKEGVIPNSVQDREQINEYMTLLESCQAMYASKNEFRREREINRKYLFGDQFCEMIPDPDTPGHEITEREYIAKQGMTPLSLNIIHMYCKAMSGLYTQEKMEPLVKSRIREEQKIGELLTIVMQHVFQKKNIYQSVMSAYKEFQMAAVPALRSIWKYDEELKEHEVDVQPCDLDRMFWDANIGTSDKYFRDISTIGYLHDMPKAEVVATFATSLEEAQQIEAAYNDVHDQSITQYSQQLSNHDESIAFYAAFEPYKCRVIEVWSKESHNVFQYHDPATGELFTLPATEQSKLEIAEINATRIADMIAAGGNPEDAVVIGEPVFRVDRDWVCRYLTPTGLLLRQEVSPYLHGSHPFVIGAFPLIDGRVRSIVGDLRNTQRMINRTLTRAEFAAMNAWKGAKWFNAEILERSQISIDELRKIYTSANGVVPLRLKEGEENRIMGALDNRNSQVNISEELRKIEYFMSIADKTSGINGSVRGERPTSGTPSSLYAQEAANSNNNIADPVTWFNGLTEKLYYKILMLILQHYDFNRYHRIAGDDYIDTINYILNSDNRQILCDVALIKSPSTGITRAQTEDLLLTMYQRGDISREVLLESTNVFGADKVLERIRNEEQRMAEQAAANPQTTVQGPMMPMQ